jgi:hypothetical protein
MVFTGYSYVLSLSSLTTDDDNILVSRGDSRTVPSGRQTGTFHDGVT